MKMDYLDIFLFHQPFLVNVSLLSSPALWKNIISRPFTLGKTILRSCEIVWVMYFSKTAELLCLLNTNIQLFHLNYGIETNQRNAQTTLTKKTEQNKKPKKNPNKTKLKKNLVLFLSAFKWPGKGKGRRNRCREESPLIKASSCLECKIKYFVTMDVSKHLRVSSSTSVQGLILPAGKRKLHYVRAGPVATDIREA